VIEQRRQNLARKELAWLRRGAPARTSKPKFRIDAANVLIEDVPEIRDKVSLQSLAVSRLGKDVVDLLDAGVSYGDRDVLRDVEWRIAPGSAPASSASTAPASRRSSARRRHRQPTSGRVKRGTTVKVATLTQRMDELEEHLDDPVRVVISRLRTSYTIGTGSKATELTPGSSSSGWASRRRSCRPP
jgi:ATPase subunit of ABC transporter with duplicated ATPase domains